MEDFLLRKPMAIKDRESLETLSGLLHDEFFDLDGVRFDEAARVVTITVRRQCHSGPESLVRRGLIFKTYEKEWMRSVVTIRRVRSWEALHDQGIGTYSFNTWRWSDDVVEAECCETFVLKFHVDQLDIEVADTGFQGKARIKRGPCGMESSTSRVYGQ